MHCSERVLAINESPIRKLLPYAHAAVEQGKKVYHLNIGQPDLPTPATFMERISHFKAATIKYGDSHGNKELIKAIQEYYREWGMDYAADDIYITNGASEALGFAILSLCDPGDELLVFEPFYSNYSSIASMYNVKLKAVPTSPENGYRLPDEATIEKAITPRTKAILANNPGNPTGVIFTDEEMAMLARLTIKHDIVLIADETYREYVFEGKMTSFGTFPELDQNLVITDSVSKRYSACGLRIGCIITKNKELCQQFLKCCQSRLCSPTLEQYGASALYTTPASYLTDTNKEYKKRSETLKRELAKIPGLQSSQPCGAFYVMVKLPVDDAEKFATWLLKEFDVDGETVMITPGAGFYQTPGRGVDEVRLAYVLNCEALEKAIRIMGAGLKKYPGYTLK